MEKSNTFFASRIFHTSRGWYIQLRESDRASMERLSAPSVDDGESIYAGPFCTRERLENWFDFFTQTHNSPRSAQKFIPDHLILTEFVGTATTT